MVMMKRMRIKYFQKNQLLHVVPPSLAFPHLELGVAETILKTASITGLVTSLGHPGVMHVSSSIRATCRITYRGRCVRLRHII